MPRHMNLFGPSAQTGKAQGASVSPLLLSELQGCCERYSQILLLNLTRDERVSDVLERIAGYGIHSDIVPYSFIQPVMRDRNHIDLLRTIPYKYVKPEGLLGAIAGPVFYLVENGEQLRGNEEWVKKVRNKQHFAFYRDGKFEDALPILSST